MSFDFLSVALPQIAIPSIREIRASTHINLELRSDFIAAFAKNAVKPINAFSADLTRSIPAKIVPDIKIDTPPVINITPRSSTVEHTLADTRDISSLEKIFRPLFAELQRDKDVMMDTDTFREYFRSELLASGMDTVFFDHMWNTTKIDTENTQREIADDISLRSTLLRTYLDAESAHTKEQEKVLHRMYRSDILLSGDIPRAFFVSDRENIATKALARYTASLSTS